MSAWWRLVHLLQGAFLARGQLHHMQSWRAVLLPGPVADIYKAVEELTKRYPGRPFTPDGHLVGSIGEVIAKEALADGFELVRPSTPGYDATCSVRGEVRSIS